MKKLLPLIAALLLSACGTTAQLTSADLNKPIPAGESRIIVKRTNEFLFGAARAKVSVNGQAFGSLGVGGEAITNVKAGRQTLNVTTDMAFGSWTETVDTKAGKTYHYVTSPNPSFGKLTGGLIYDAATADTNSGYFKIEQIK